MTPFAAWTGQEPNIKHPGVFEWEVYACVPKHERKEIASKARECIVLSYGNEKRVYYFCTIQKMGEPPRVSVMSSSTNRHKEL